MISSMIYRKKHSSSNTMPTLLVSNSEMCHFSSEQGRTRVFTEAYMRYAAGGNPRRTLLRGKRAISGWTLDIESEVDYIAVLNPVLFAL
jgi:hypothetical protein